MAGENLELLGAVVARVMDEPCLVRMSAEQYHGDPSPEPSLSSSLAHTLVARSPQHAWLLHPKLGGRARRPTRQMDTGTLVHAILLGAGSDIAVVEADDWRTKAAREARDSLRAAGKIPVLQHEVDAAQEAAEAIRHRLEGFGIRLTGESELCAFWTEVADDGTRVRCRGMFDHLIVEDGRVVILDLKTSKSAHPRACASHMFHYGYDIQQAAYRSAIGQIMRRFAGREEFVFLFAELEPPYCVTPAMPAGTMRELGHRRWRRAINLWAECRNTNRWPGYATDIVQIEAPMWALSEEELSYAPRTQQPDDPTKRTFEDKPAIRGKVPLLVGIMGPSGGGKTFSALRLATGIQRVSGGDIYVVDTEARRSLHYAGVKPTKDGKPFAFRHVPFTPPFGPLHYLAALEHCMKRGAGVIIVDSMSHEHEGPGGVLEMHEREVQRLAGGDARKAERVKMLAWGKPKADRRRLINSVLQMPCHFIFCFRAKNKLKIQPGKEPEHRGYMPIAGEEFVYEMALNMLMLPNAGGIPTWQSNETGEKEMIKLPLQFQALFAKREPVNEDHGEQLAIWSEGVRSETFQQIETVIQDAATLDELDALKPRMADIKTKKAVPPAEFNALLSLIEDRKRAILNPRRPLLLTRPTKTPRSTRRIASSATTTPEARSSTRRLAKSETQSDPHGA